MANFAAPSQSRTWQFQVNTTVAAQATATLTCARMLRFAKDAMLGTGAWTDSANAATASSGNWSVVSSCDGSGGAGSFGNNDNVDRWDTDAKFVWAAPGGNHSWMVLKQTGMAGGPHYLYLDLNQAGLPHRLQAGWSTTLYTNGTATAAPSGANLTLSGTAASPYPLAASFNWGGPSANAACTMHVMKSADGKATRVIFTRNGWGVGLWIFDELQNAPAGWTAPAVCYLSGADSASAPVSDTALVQGQMANGGNAISLVSVNSNVALACMHLHYFGANSLVTTPTVANDMAAAWPAYRIGVYVRPNQGMPQPAGTPIVNARGYCGVIRDLWWVQSQLGEGDTMPAAATKNFVVLGDTLHPWNTTVIDRNGGAAGAAVDGYEVPLTPYFEITEQPLGTTSTLPIVSTIEGAPVVYYIMQAIDSVDGLRYDWTVPSTPDRAGVYYSGPNSPTDIVVAGMRLD